jgi:hypothetical protein
VVWKSPFPVGKSKYAADGRVRAPRAATLNAVGGTIHRVELPGSNVNPGIGARVYSMAVIVAVGKMSTKLMK